MSTLSQTLRCSLCKTLRPLKDYTEAQARKGGPDAVCNECLAPGQAPWERWLPTVLFIILLASLGAFMLYHAQAPRSLNVSDLWNNPGPKIRQAIEDVDEWRKSFTHELYKGVTEGELAKAVRWIKHADPFSKQRSCASFFTTIYQQPRMYALLSSLRDISWNAQELKDLIANYAYHTTGLDGNSLTLPETMEVVERKKCEHCDKIAGNSITEVKNIDKLLKSYALFRMDGKEDYDITMQTLIDLNTAVLHDLGVPLGLRKYAGGIAKRKILIPMPDELLHLVERYVAWLKESMANLKPDDYSGAIQLACDAHTRFLHIHPFADGNGRVARILAALVLRKVGLPAPMIPRDNYEQYTDAVSEATMNQQYKKICQLFYDGVINTLQHMNDLVEKRTTMR